MFILHDQLLTFCTLIIFRYLFYDSTRLMCFCRYEMLFSSFHESLSIEETLTDNN